MDPLDLPSLREDEFVDFTPSPVLNDWQNTVLVMYNTFLQIKPAYFKFYNANHFFDHSHMTFGNDLCFDWIFHKQTKQSSYFYHDTFTKTEYPYLNLLSSNNLSFIKFYR